MAEPNPHLDIHAPENPRGIVVVLHGGREHGQMGTHDRQLAVLRARPFASRIRTLAGKDLVVARMRYTVRGWNGTDQSPVKDARIALKRLTDRFGTLPIALVGYSMGGRTALYVADHPSVTTIVGLAPWTVKGEHYPVQDNCNLLIIHGTHDRTTSWKGSRFLTAALHAEGANASFVEVTGEGHPMLRKPVLWHDLTAGYVIHHLTGQSVRVRVPNLLQRVLEGEAHITV